jgi:hypothetical protein
MNQRQAFTDSAALLVVTNPKRLIVYPDDPANSVSCQSTLLALEGSRH